MLTLIPAVPTVRSLLKRYQEARLIKRLLKDLYA